VGLRAADRAESDAWYAREAGVISVADIAADDRTRTDRGTAAVGGSRRCASDGR
jgi:hypothetical protein